MPEVLRLPSSQASYFKGSRIYGHRARSKESGNELFLYGDIGGWGVSASEFVAALNEFGDDDLVLRINSGGGDVFDGLAMYEALRARKGHTITRIDALAASAASLVALAGDEVEIAENAFVMIHRAWGVSIGNAPEMRKIADVLDKVDAQMASIYSSHMEIGDVQARELMAAETWFNADEAITASIADRKVERSEASAALVPGRYAKLPKELACEEPKQVTKGVVVPLVTEGDDTRASVDRMRRKLALVRREA